MQVGMKVAAYVPEFGKKAPDVGPLQWKVVACLLVCKCCRANLKSNNR